MVTWFQLGIGLLLLVGLAMTGFGGLEVLGGMMSDAPVDGEKIQRSGCVLAIVGMLIIIFAICVLIWG